jgi:transposase
VAPLTRSVTGGRTLTFLPVSRWAQLVPGTVARALHHMVDGLDVKAFDAHFRNDKAGAAAHAPRMPLKAVLLGYSQGLISSRAIERSCRDNVLFVAVTGDAKPHITTIADFVSRSRDAIASVFGQVSAVLDSEGLIGHEMPAIDGVKVPSNASKHRSGMRAEFAERADKLDRKLEAILDRQRGNDALRREGATSHACQQRGRRGDSSRTKTRFAIALTAKSTRGNAKHERSS